MEISCFAFSFICLVTPVVLWQSLIMYHNCMLVVRAKLDSAYHFGPLMLPFYTCPDCRSLLASKSIQTGDCMLRVPDSVVLYFDFQSSLSTCYYLKLAACGKPLLLHVSEANSTRQPPLRNQCFGTWWSCQCCKARYGGCSWAENGSGTISI